MKDTVITARRKKKELTILIACFVAAIVVNIWAIIKFDRSWIELFTQIGFTTSIALFFYVLTVVVRLTIVAVTKIFHIK